MWAYQQVRHIDLTHYGIIGQKWGVRRFQNKDGTYTKKGLARLEKDLRGKELDDYGSGSIPKGQALYRTTVNSNESSSGMKYVSLLDSDRDTYKGGWIRNTAKADTAYEDTSKTTEEIRYPSIAETKKVTESVMSDTKLRVQAAKQYTDMMFRNANYDLYYDDKELRSMAKDTVKGLLESMKNDPAASWRVGSRTFGVNETIKTRVASELKKKGYNAMIDAAGVGGYSEGTSKQARNKEGALPLIVFDSGKSMSKTGSIEISRTDEAKSRENKMDWQRKQRQIR